MTDTEQRVAAAKFTEDWKSRGDEKQETQRFWIELLTKVFGVDGSTAISFEVPVKLDHTSFIDGYIESTRVLIEQKGRDIDLRKGYKQSDGSMLTPYQQARRYAGYLPYNQVPRWKSSSWRTWRRSTTACNSLWTLAANISRRKWKSPCKLVSW